MTRKRIQYTTDDPDKFTLQEMTEKKQKKSVKVRQTKGVVIDAIINRFEERKRNHWK